MSPRLLRFRLRLLKYDCKVSYVPGKYQQVPDAMSRAPIPLTGEESQIEAVEAHSQFHWKKLNMSDLMLQNVRDAQNSDPILKRLKDFMGAYPGSRPIKKEFPVEILKFFPIYEELTIIDDVLLKGSRVVIAKEMQKEMLRLIHEGHQGINKCQRRARDNVWWSGINDDIMKLVSNCQTCCKFQAEKAQPMIASEVPLYPWQKIGIDFMHFKGVSYLVLVDYLSRWIEIVKTNSLSAISTINNLKIVFSRYGIPEEIRSDNNPFNSTEFQQFCLKYKIKHVTSSPRYPQSNGASERAVKTAKSFLQKCTDSGDDLLLALLNYRTTPLETGYSPADIMMGRKLRTLVPRPNYTTRITNLDDFRHKDEINKEKQSKNYNSRKNAKPKADLSLDDEIYIPKEQISGKIVGKDSKPRSYIIETEKGLLRRTHDQMNRLPQGGKRERQEIGLSNNSSPHKPTSHPSDDKQKAPSPITKIKEFIGIPTRRSQRHNKGVPPDRFQVQQ